MGRRLFIQLSLLQFLQYFMWGAWFVTAGTYLMEGLSFSGRQVGFIYASFSIGATISPLIIGVIADKFFSVEKLLSVLHLMGGVLLLSLPFIQEFTLFYGIMFAYVLCYVPTFSLSNSLCFHHISNAKEDFPKVRVWGTFGWIAAGFLVGFLAIEDQSSPFFIAAGASILQGLFCFTLPKTPPSTSDKNIWQSFLSPEVKKLFKSTSFTILIICVGLICIPRSYYYSFVNPFLNEVGVQNAAGKMALGQVVEIILMLFLPWILRNWKFKTVIFLGLFAWGVRYGLFILGDEFNMEWIIIVGILIHAPAFLFSNLTVQIYLDTKVPASLRSTAQGFFSLLSMGILALLGALIAGETVSYYQLDDGKHMWDNIWMFPFIFGTFISFIFLLTFKPKQSD